MTIDLFFQHSIVVGKHLCIWLAAMEGKILILYCFSLIRYISIKIDFTSSFLQMITSSFSLYLMLIYIYNRKEVVKILMNRGGYPYYATKSGDTCVDYAQSSRDIIRLLSSIKENCHIDKLPGLLMIVTIILIISISFG